MNKLREKIDQHISENQFGYRKRWGDKRDDISSATFMRKLTIKILWNS